MGLSSTGAAGGGRPSALLATSRVTLLVAICVAYLLGLSTRPYLQLGLGSSGTAALLQTWSGPSVPVGVQDMSSLARAIVDDAAAAREVDEQVVEQHQQQKPQQQQQQGPAAAVAAAFAAAPPRPSPRRTVIKLRDSLTCPELLVLRA